MSTQPRRKGDATDTSARVVPRVIPHLTPGGRALRVRCCGTVHVARNRDRHSTEGSKNQ
jgi:hypothetical protein